MFKFLGRRNNHKKNSQMFLGLVLCTLLFSACVPEVGQTKVKSKKTGSNSVDNSTLQPGQGRVLLDNPLILSKNTNLPDTADLTRYISDPVSIINDSFLQNSGPCAGLETCFEVKANSSSSSPLQSETKKWGFATKSTEFTQVHTYYHMNKIIDEFYQTIYFGYDLAYDNGVARYPTSLPSTLVDFNQNINFYWEKNLDIYADCGLKGNAYFDPAKMVLCFGEDSKYANVKFAHDPTVIYHEAGHFFVKLMMNLRNDPSNPIYSYLGFLSYDEAASIGEGLADYFSFYVNGRTHVGEWALGRFLKQARPISEDDPSHPAGIGTEDGASRISYPEYLNYDSNFPTSPLEDVHYGGNIIAHYLVAQSKDLESQCSLSTKNASNAVMNLVIETLSELGDQSGKGKDDALTGGNTTTLGRINGSAAYSLKYFELLNPINYRSFTQTFAKYLKLTFGNSAFNMCNGSVYSTDRIEQMLDTYGLLLFRTYNENRNESTMGSNTEVNPANRSKSTLIKKSFLKFDPTDGQPKAYVIDNRSQISQAITAMRLRGLATDISSQIPSDFGFNNDNGRINRGEIIGLVPNLYNDSNLTMGGVQVLANDWDHVTRVTVNTVTKTAPCIFEDDDNWPSTSEGGINSQDNSLTHTCATTTLNPTQTSNEVAPICLVQFSGSSATQWISQDEYRTKKAMDTSMCLDPSNPKSCLIRVIKGADQATYSKLNPKSTWANTLKDPTTGKAPAFKYNNVLFFEISKNIPPGTVFDCRFRARFTNCDDCFHDQSNARKNYDYLDNEYNGHRPYKILHFQFTVTD